MASMALAIGSLRSLSLSSVAGPSNKAPHFAEFSGLASVGPRVSSTSTSLLPVATTSRRGVDWSIPLQIVAREPTRKETVKVRHRRIRKKLNGTTERPRLAVFRSNKHLYAQVIDDTTQHTLASSSTLKKAVREELQLSSGPTVILECKSRSMIDGFTDDDHGGECFAVDVVKDAAKKVGEEIAKVCLEKGITMVAFDRGGFVYHGRIRALADAAREGGLAF